MHVRGIVGLAFVGTLSAIGLLGFSGYQLYQFLVSGETLVHSTSDWTVMGMLLLASFTCLGAVVVGISDVTWLAPLVAAGAVVLGVALLGVVGFMLFAPEHWPSEPDLTHIIPAIVCLMFPARALQIAVRALDFGTK